MNDNIKTEMTTADIRSRAAVKLLSILETRNEKATPEELKGLAEVANSISNLLDPIDSRF